MERSKVTPRILDIDRQAYAQQWSTGNAAQLERGGHYAWMAEFVDGFHKVLEIGTGDGRGTLALLNRGHVVVGVDENPRCLSLAVDRLKEEGYSVAYAAREKARETQDNYDVVYRYPRCQAGANQVLLLEGDVLGDPKLRNWLRDNGPFDAVVCWLIGTHAARSFNGLFDTLPRPVTNVTDYRYCVQSEVYKIAEQVVRPGGIVHMVDRGQFIRDQEKRGMLTQCHQMLAVSDQDEPRGVRLWVRSLHQQLYEEVAEGEGVPMRTTTTERYPDAGIGPLALLSVVVERLGDEVLTAQPNKWCNLKAQD